MCLASFVLSFKNLASVTKLLVRNSSYSYTSAVRKAERKQSLERKVFQGIDAGLSSCEALIMHSMFAGASLGAFWHFSPKADLWDQHSYRKNANAVCFD